MIDKFALQFQQSSWYFISVIAIISSFGFSKLKKNYENKNARLIDGRFDVFE